MKKRNRLQVSYIRAICPDCLRGYESLAVGAPMLCVSCNSTVRALADPLHAAVFNDLPIWARNELKLAGNRELLKESAS